jgi:hypothetical protein
MFSCPSEQYRPAQIGMGVQPRETLIATARGELPLSQLQPGDLVLTRDNGLQPIRRIVTVRGVAAGAVASVTIRQGALGAGMPHTNITVSANHRILVTGEIAAMLFDDTDALIAAHQLVGLSGVETSPAGPMLHMEFDHHEVVLSNGCWTECFNPTDRPDGKAGEAVARELALAMSADRDAGQAVTG